MHSKNKGSILASSKEPGKERRILRAITASLNLTTFQGLLKHRDWKENL